MKTTDEQKVLILTASIVSLVSFTIFAEDWPAWRGPNHTGISAETGWNPSALAKGAKITWRKNIGVGHSSFAIQGSYLYTMGNIENKDIIYCFNVTDGSEVWRYTYPCKEGNYPGPRSTPVIDGNYLYTCSRDANVFCFDAASGKVIWNADLKTKDQLKEPQWGFASSPSVEDELLLLNIGDHGIALNKLTGSRIWASGSSDASYATPVVFKNGTVKYAAIFGAKGMKTVELQSGKLIWSHPWKTSYDVHAADPIIANNTMFISSGYGTGAALLDIKDTTPSVIWQNTDMKNHFNSSILIDDYLYGIDGNTGGGAVTCMEIKTGKVKWQHGKGYEGLMAADNKLIIMDKEGNLTIASADPTGFKPISSAKVLTDKKAKNWTVPVLANGSIYCRNSIGDIACVDMRK